MSRPPVLKEPHAVRQNCDQIRREGRSVALVPTMGALHQGHLALVDEARERSDYCVASIFVNPTQFGPDEDLQRYPRDLDGDLDKLAQRGVDLVFVPETKLIYPSSHATSVRVSGLTARLCGVHRPGHFDGVTTVVAILFNMIGPCTAVFGRKDFQQLQVIRQMVEDLKFQVEVVAVPTVREKDGLALSSRNAYLSAEARQRALSLYRGLRAAHLLFDSGERQVGALRQAVAATVEQNCDQVDYVSAADPATLEELPDETAVRERLLIAIAARIGPTRLIDNTVLGEDLPPAKGEDQNDRI